MTARRMQEPEGYVATRQGEDDGYDLLNTCHIREKAAEEGFRTADEGR